MFTIQKCRDPKSVSDVVNRLQIMYKRSKGTHQWCAFVNAHPNAVVWVTNHYRVLGLGEEVLSQKTSLADGEIAMPFSLPWHGCGNEVSEIVTKVVDLANKRHRRQYGVAGPYEVGPPVA